MIPVRVTQADGDLELLTSLASGRLRGAEIFDQWVTIAPPGGCAIIGSALSNAISVRIE